MSTDSNRRVLVLTGASRGIGHATVKRFSSAGWRVITCSRHPFPENCPWEAGPEDHVQVDLGDPEDRARAVLDLRKRLNGGPVHALVNNAGISPKGPKGERLNTLSTSEEDWRKVFEVNFFAPVVLARGLIERIGHFRSRYPGIRLVVSTESEPAGLDDAQRLVYYACARFLVLRRLAERYRCPIFVLDIDAVFRGGLADVARTAQGADLGLYLRRPQRIVWTNVAAGRFLVNPTLAADAYLLMVEAYIRRALRNRRMDWFLDQVALYCCLILMRRFEQAPTVYELNDDLDRAMYAFPARFSEKLDDPLYTQYFVQF